MESRIEVCIFIRCLKRMRGEIFYSLKDKNVVVNTHTTFLEKDYMTNYKLKSIVILEEIAFG